MVGGHPSNRLVEHSPNCSYVQSQGECNCFLSWNVSLLQAESAFQPATADEDSEGLGQLEEAQDAAIREYKALKQAMITNLRQERPENCPYHTLGPGEIRVLELRSGEFGSELSGTFHIADVQFEYPMFHNWTYWTNHAISLVGQTPIWYTALSYVWGSPGFDVKFKLDGGHTVQITTTLACALQHLRATKHSVFLWIDQICIDQANLKEKEKQIPLMGQIYSHATNCLVWLGDSGEDDPSVAFETLYTVHSRLQFSDQEITTNDFERLYFPNPSDVAWWEVKALFRRSWFKRTWTIQEAVLPLNVFVKCGKACVSLRDLASWCLTFKSCGLMHWLASNTEVDALHSRGISTDDLPPASGCATILSLYMERPRAQWDKQNLLGLLVKTRYAEATEPKDKIYGILGLTDSEITPTYSKNVTTRQVYHEASFELDLVEMHRLLSCVDHEIPLRPSWIPSWSTPRVTESLGYSTMTHAMYHAGGKGFNPRSGLLYPSITSGKVDRKVLKLSGKIFDTIATLGDVTTNASIDIDSPKEGNEQWISYLDIAKANHKNVTGDTLFDAFWQTLVAGKDGAGIAKCPQEYSEVMSLIIDSSTGNMPSLPGQKYSPRRLRGFFTLDSLRSRVPAKTLADLRKSFRAALQNRRFAVSSKGYFSLVPRGTLIGDIACVFESVRVPFILRTTKDEQGFELVGECYVHGIMKGEVMGMESILIRPITLV